MKRPSLGLLLSCAAHAAVVAGVVAVLDVAAPHVLFVDLVHGLGLAVSGRGAGGGGSSGEPEAGDKAEPGGRATPRPVATPRAAPAARPRPATEAPRPPVAASPPIVTPVPEPERAPAAIAAVEPTPPDVRPVPAPETRAAPSAPSAAPSAPPETRPAPDAMSEARTVPAPPSSLSTPGTVSPSAAAGIGSATPGAAQGAAAGGFGVGAGERGPRAGEGGPGSGGGLGAGSGVNQGSAVALAVPGDGASVPAEYEGYFALLRSRLHEAIRYPAVARRRSLTGQVVIEVRVTSSGEVDRAHVVTSSSHSVLDEAALEAARGLRVPFPPGLRPRTLSMRLPVDFVLQ